MRRNLGIVAVLLLLAVSVAMPVAADAYTVTVASDGASGGVNIRSAPAMDATVVTQVPPGTSLRLNSADVITDGDGWHWLPVTLADGRNGFIRQDLVTGPASTILSGTSYPQIDARDLAKAPYRYQGQTFCQMGVTFNVLETSDGATIIQMYPTLPYQITAAEAYDDAITVTYAGSVPGLYKDMRIVVYGAGAGVNTFINAFGGTVSQPLVRADRVDNVTGNPAPPCQPPRL